MDTKTKNDLLVQIGGLKDTMLTLRNRVESLTDTINRTPTIDLAGFEDLTEEESTLLTVVAMVNKGFIVKRHPEFGVCCTSDQIHWQQLVIVEEAKSAQSTGPEFQHHFVGPDSLFNRYLAANVIEGGKGKFCPPNDAVPDSGNKPLPQFTDDITSIMVEKLSTYETGFYRTRGTKNLQFFLNAGKVLLYVDMLPNQHNPVLVLVSDEHGGVRVPLNMLDVTMFTNLYVILEGEFERLLKETPSV